MLVPSMSRAQFQMIAQTILDLPESVTPAMRHLIACRFADDLRATNSNFKRDLFIQAATGVVPVTARKALSVPSTVEG